MDLVRIILFCYNIVKCYWTRRFYSLLQNKGATSRRPISIRYFTMGHFDGAPSLIIITRQLFTKRTSWLCSVCNSRQTFARMYARPVQKFYSNDSLALVELYRLTAFIWLFFGMPFMGSVLEVGLMECKSLPLLKKLLPSRYNTFSRQSEITINFWSSVVSDRRLTKIY